MPFDSNGNYTLPTSYFVENGDTVLPIQHNPPLEDVAQALGLAVLRDGRSPFIGNLNAGSFKITNLAAGTNDGDSVRKSQIDDPWYFMPIGVPLPLDIGTGVFTAPPRDRSYRYVLLSAGATGSGLYNEGILTSEIVSGSWPIINATGVISLSGSPFNGVTIRLINSTREFLRPGVPGGLQDSTFTSHNHSGNTSTDGNHQHEVPSELWSNNANPGGASNFVNPSGAGYFNQNIAGRFTLHAGAHFHSFVTSLSGGEETRPRNLGANFYMRIK
ncbi:hypothetical protein D3C80_130540 [compost metagenome]